MSKKTVTEKIEMTCGIGCAILLLLFILSIIGIYISIKWTPIERKAVDYIIEHQEEFQKEFRDMGYKLDVAYTYGDIWETDDIDKAQGKLGHKDRGIIILYNEKEKYFLDIGIERYELYKDEGTTICIENCTKVLTLKEKWYDKYPVKVMVYGDNVYKKYDIPLYNYYAINFIDYRSVLHHEGRMNAGIKEYISAEELREMYEKGIDLQNKLVEMYKQHKGMLR